MMNYNGDFFKNSMKQVVDELNRFLLVVLAILIILTIFLRYFVLDLIKVLLLVIIIFRLVSKNKIQRQKENQKFLAFLNTLAKPFKTLKRNWIDRDNYVYRKCHKCHTTLKLPLPSKRGINHAKCPNCHNRVTIFTLRKYGVKVEVIKKKR